METGKFLPIFVYYSSLVYLFFMCFFMLLLIATAKDNETKYYTVFGRIWDIKTNVSQVPESILLSMVISEVY